MRVANPEYLSRLSLLRPDCFTGEKRDVRSQAQILADPDIPCLEACGGPRRATRYATNDYLAIVVRKIVFEVGVCLEFFINYPVLSICNVIWLTCQI